VFNLLVVDDEDIIRRGIMNAVDWSKFGVQAFEARNGLDAYYMLQQEEFHIVISDVKMPGLDGLELLKKVKDEFPYTVFIILSGYAEFAFASEAMKYGVKHYLLKPTDEQEIELVLEKAIGEVERMFFSYEKVVSKFSAISEAIKEEKLCECQELINCFFQMIRAAKLNEKNYRSYCMELFLNIVRDCKCSEGASKYFKKSEEIENATCLEHIKDIVLNSVSEIININQALCNSKYSRVIRELLQYVNDNISDEELSLTAIANNCLYMNPDYLGKLFKKEMNECFNQYVKNVRIEKAKRLMDSDSNLKIGEIAERVGFGTNSQYFSQVFKKCTGCSPKEYRESTENS
jgi:two-component system, response regulator YesN